MLLECIVNVFPIADLPELIITFLAGDCCLDAETIKAVFPRPYLKSDFDTDTHTYLDKECTVLHSFNDEPAVVWPTGYRQKSWYFNGQGRCKVFYYPTTYHTSDSSDKTVFVHIWNGHVNVNGVNIQL